MRIQSGPMLVGRFLDGNGITEIIQKGQIEWCGLEIICKKIDTEENADAMLHSDSAPTPPDTFRPSSQPSLIGDRDHREYVYLNS